MNLKKWYKARGFRFVWQRATSLLDRYGVTNAKAIHRIDDCMETLARWGCAPTFPAPGIVVQRYPQFIRHLQDSGAEIAVHGYQHIDLSALPVPVARQQLVRAARTFERLGIEVRGFRCPYIGCSDALLDALPGGMFDYSSNKAICWESVNSGGTHSRSKFFDILRQFYRAELCSNAVCLPSMRSNLIEIPVCVPDDLQLYDGLQLGPEGIGQVWSQMLGQAHQRGELFTLVFHPELATCLEPSFVAVLDKARQLYPGVWISRLRDISDWWREKSSFKVDVSYTSAGLHVSFFCSERATILARGLDPSGPKGAWDGPYYRLQTREIDVPVGLRPFVGLAPDVPASVTFFLQEQGYILDTSDTATCCGTFIDVGILGRLTSQVQLVDYIEASTNPLVRYWRWPDGAKSVLSVTGDMDALTILDYASRLFVR